MLLIVLSIQNSFHLFFFSFAWKMYNQRFVMHEQSFLEIVN